MNFKISSIFSLSIFILVSSSSIAQYKYDIGLKVSSYDMERFQLEQRFHLDNPYSIVVTLASGSQGSGDYHQSAAYSDSLFDVTQSYRNDVNNVLKIGVQRKLGFLATDVFYAGATLGFGFEKQRSTLNSATYLIKDSSEIYPYFPNPNLVVSSSENSFTSNSINVQAGLSFGMDVPITKRFSINAEVTFAAIYEKSFDYSTSYIFLRSSLSGGLRYCFGKRV